MSGPSVVLFFSNQSVDRATLRADLVADFMVLHVAALPGYIAGGLLTSAMLQYAAPLVPGPLLGLAEGRRRFAGRRRGDNPRT